MCVEFTLGGENVKVKTEFFPKGLVLIENSPQLCIAEQVSCNESLYWDGWVQKEQVSNYTIGTWRKAEIFATKFNQRGRWYDVPKGEIIKAIAFSSDDRVVFKIVTRLAVGLEKKVQERFAMTSNRFLIEK